MSDIRLSATLKPYWVQVSTHGCHYTCKIKKENGIWFFKFKRIWYKVDDYIDEHTYVNTMFQSD